MIEKQKIYYNAFNILVIFAICLEGKLNVVILFFYYIGSEKRRKVVFK